MKAINKKIKILIVIPSLEIGGGAEKNAYALGREFSKFFDVEYLTFYNNQNQYIPKQKIHCLNEVHKKNIFMRLVYVIKRIFFIKKVCKSYQPSLLLSFGFKSSILVSTASFIRNYKVILSIRSDINSQSFVTKHASLLLFNHMDMVHAVSKKMLNNLKSLGIRKLVHINNGHNIDNYLKLSNDNLEFNIQDKTYVYLNIGRLNNAKGQWHLLKSFSLCVSKYPNSILIIIGEGELYKDLMSLARSLNIEDKVFMVGNVPNIFPYLKKADCFCLSSLYEGLPNVLIEALSIGTPIISTDCISGPREILFPELELDQPISYPYKSNGNILAAPFSVSDINVTLDIKNSEIEYAKLMEEARFIDVNKSNKNIKSYTEDIVFKKWNELIDRLCSI